MGLTVGEVRALFDADSAQFDAAVARMDQDLAALERSAEHHAAQVARAFNKAGVAAATSTGPARDALGRFVKGSGEAAAAAERGGGFISGFFSLFTRGIPGVGRLGPALSGLRGQLNGFNASLFSGATALRTFYATAAGSAAAVAGLLLVRTAIHAASEQEDAVQKLNTALRVLGTDGAREASDAIQAYAAQTQKSTRFADEATIGAAARIAAFVKQKDAILLLTGAAQDFATATGTDLESAANLLGKSVGSSTNALARYGIAVTGAVGSSERLRSAVDGIQRVFGGQANAAAQTFAGSLDVVGNRFGEVLEALGNLITANPAAISLLGQLGGTFDDLAESINANRDALAKGLLQGLATGIGVVASFAKALAEGTRFLGEMGVTAKSLGTALVAVRDIFAAFFSAISTGFRVVKAGVLEFLATLEDLPTRVRDAAESFKSLQNQSTGKLQRDLADATKQVQRLREERDRLNAQGAVSAAAFSADALAAQVRRAFEANQELRRRGAVLSVTIDPSETRKAADAAMDEVLKSAFATDARLQTALSSLGTLFAGDTGDNAAITGVLEEVGRRAGLAKEQVDALVASFTGLRQQQPAAGPAGTQSQVFDPEDLEKGQKLLKQITEQQQDAAAKLKGPLVEEALAIQRQVDELRKATLTEAERTQANALITQLLQKQGALLARNADAQASIEPLQRAVSDQLARLAQLDPQAAGEFANEVGRRVGAAVGPEAQQQALAALATELGRKIEEEAEPSLAKASGAGLASGIQAALAGDNGLAAFGATLAQVGQESLTKAFTEASDGLGKVLEGVFGQAFAGLGGALAGILGGVIGAVTRRTESSSSSGSVRSAVDSTERVRGVIAGPSQIAIAQVGESIRDAWTEPTRVLEIIARNTAATARAAAAAATPAARAAADPSAFSLANESVGLA